MDELNFNEIKNQSIENAFNGSDLYDKCHVDLKEDMKPPEILLSIGEHAYKDDVYPTAVMTAGEFSAIIASSKSKKTFLKSAFIGSYIGKEASILFPNIKSHRREQVTVLDFDTEQGKYYSQRTFRRVNEMTGGFYQYYHGYATRGTTSREKLLLIDYCLKNQDELYDKPVKLVSVDGIADLVENTNDLLMSKEAADFLLKWTMDYNIHVIAVIHKNPDSDKPLGHLGSYVLKKAESVIDLKKNPDGSILVTNPYSRGYQFDEFTFDINKNALPYEVERDSDSESFNPHKF